ncbi:hypothetical protein LTR62_000686 [Meristemomyces frigidus]|uniref:Uncharacterized protein n=1 Tax=Meristemomyces frigidus TaxID=1508187 RepID=A0AAN7T8Z8_9PEZI|nr:hypothetical protein LTR62_000686 [Meristemomyces frigidus]
MTFEHPVEEEKSYRRALFLFASIALAGACSIYPVMCFKHHSSKEKHKTEKGIANIEKRQKAEDDEQPAHHDEPLAHEPDPSEVSPPKTPSPDESVRTKKSLVSGHSSGSSFAFLLSNTRADKRLLEKRSQPLAHVTKIPLLSRHPVEKRRSPSYYQPKVVEDSAQVNHVIARGLRGSLSLTMADFIRKDNPVSKCAPSTPPMGSKSWDRTGTSSTASSDRSRPLSVARTKPQEMPGTKKSSLLRTSTGKNLTLSLPPAANLAARQSTRERSRSRESIHRRQQVATLSQLLLRPTTQPVRSNQQYHNVTPPEAEPRSPDQSRFLYSDHYFRTFGGELMYTSSLAPGFVPATPGTQSPVVPPALEVAWKDVPETASDTGDVQAHKKRSSIFQLFREAGTLSRARKGSRAVLEELRPPSSIETPVIQLSPSPALEPVLRRRLARTISSDYSLPPYFRQSRRRDQSSATTSSSQGLSPGASPYSRPGMGHQRMPSSESSTPLSPISIPRKRPRLYGALGLESIEDIETSPVGSPIVSQSGEHSHHDAIFPGLQRPSEQIVLPVKATTPPSMVNAVSASLVEAQVPEQTKAHRSATIKQVIFESRDLHAVPSYNTLTSVPDTAMKHGSSLISRASRASVASFTKPKATRKKLRRKSSLAPQANNAQNQMNTPSIVSRLDLEVTGF